jgi:hypothetical protein
MFLSSKKKCFITFFFFEMTYFDKVLMQGLSKYCKKNYHDFKRFFQEYLKNILGIFP